MDPEPARAMARQWSLQGPDLVLLPGDLVYQDGRIREYRRFFFPVYNGGGAAGAPLMRGTPFVAVLGNHDVGERGPRHPHAVDPDSMAYYLYWDQPLNGPPLEPEGPHAPLLAPGPDWSWAAFLAAAGKRFPTLGNFSFDSGDVHWTVLDSNPHVRWEAPELREWLARDLEAARGAPWRIVLFHHPPFNLGDGNVYQDQWMARLWPVFEQGRVDLVFTGHIHTYVRTRPIRFTPAPAAPGPAATVKGDAAQAGEVPGRLAWDPRFDGRTRTEADGVILIVTGGGGAPLHLKGKSAQLRPKPCVVRVINEEHSFSVLDLAGRTLHFRQLGLNGAVLDSFTLTKAPGPSR
jgi:predicted phosphodiesterase